MLSFFFFFLWVHVWQWPVGYGVSILLVGGSNEGIQVHLFIHVHLPNPYSLAAYIESSYVAGPYLRINSFLDSSIVLY